MRFRLSLALLILARLGIASAVEPNAVPVSPDCTIVQIERGTAYIDAGANRGLRPGAVLQVLRTVAAKNPVTGETIVDHFPIGTLTVEQVGQVLSYGRL